jgi:hypothetical protein
MLTESSTEVANIVLGSLHPLGNEPEFVGKPAMICIISAIRR